jgi:adenosylcobinamide-phosphate synthase
VLNWIPARITCLTYCFLSRQAIRFRELYQQARCWDSPNAGPVLAAGAWALGVRLGGAARYHGSDIIRPKLGMDRMAEPEDIDHALLLIRQGLFLWLVIWLLVYQFV